MCLKQGEVEEIVKKSRGGPIWNAYGPVNINDFEVWEVWTNPDGQFETRFVTCRKGDKDGKYFGDFQAFAGAMQIAYQELQGRLLKMQIALEGAKADQHRRTFITYIAAVAFLISILLLVYLLVKGDAPAPGLVTLMGGVIASGATMFFGTWKLHQGDAGEDVS